MFKKITKQDIKEMCEWLEFYDKHHHFPFDKKKITLTLSYGCVNSLNKFENKSSAIEEAILRHEIGVGVTLPA